MALPSDVTDAPAGIGAVVVKVLRDAGLLGGAGPQRIKTVQKVNGRHWRLRIVPSDDAPEECPASVFLKVARDGGTSFDRQVAFHHEIVPMMAYAVTARFYGSAVAENGSRYLLFEDISETHENGLRLDFAQTPLMRILAALDAVAQFHAHWWEHATLRDKWLPGHLAGQKAYAQFVEKGLPAGWRRFREHFRQITDTRRHACDSILQELPGLWDTYWRQRLADGRGITLNHGDLHPGNLMFPVAHDGGHVLFADMEAYRVDTPACDLAMLIALHWSQDRATTLRLLRSYHDALCRHRVTNYAWETLLEDYGVAVMFGCHFPHYLLGNGIEALPMFDAGIDAYLALREGSKSVDRHST